jgi:hypothetical protein
MYIRIDMVVDVMSGNVGMVSVASHTNSLPLSSQSYLSIQISESFPRWSRLPLPEVRDVSNPPNRSQSSRSK